MSAPPQQHPRPQRRQGRGLATMHQCSTRLDARWARRQGGLRLRHAPAQRPTGWHSAGRALLRRAPWQVVAAVEGRCQFAAGKTKGRFCKHSILTLAIAFPSPSAINIIIVVIQEPEACRLEHPALVCQHGADGMDVEDCSVRRGQQDAGPEVKGGGAAPRASSVDAACVELQSYALVQNAQEVCSTARQQSIAHLASRRGRGVVSTEGCQWSMSSLAAPRGRWSSTAFSLVLMGMLQTLHAWMHAANLEILLFLPFPPPQPTCVHEPCGVVGAHHRQGAAPALLRQLQGASSPSAALEP